jgi:photosystem II stability/assembly factor-like uncharacterized protein
MAPYRYYGRRTDVKGESSTGSRSAAIPRRPGHQLKRAYLMSIGNNLTDFRIYKTEDGGATWTIQFENQNPNAFYNGFAFWTPNRGIAHSDSVNGCSQTCDHRRNNLAGHQ